VLAGAYVVGIAAAETILVFGGLGPGLACYALLLLALVTHCTALTFASDRERLARFGGGQLPAELEAFRRLLAALALVPLLRILSLAMLVRTAPQAYWYLMSGAPLLLATLMTARAFHVSPARLGLGAANLSRQAVIALSGIPLAGLAFVAGRPKPLLSTNDLRSTVAAVLVLVVFSAFLEELLFRGVIQGALAKVFERGSVTWTAALYGFVYLGTLSPAYVVVAFASGLFYGRCVSRTGSLWGVIASHSILSVGALLVLPQVWK
jgi:membrane protease YdiL (CAAX protease family)